MKKFLQKILVPAVLTLTATQASAYDFEVDGIYYNITSYSPYEVSVTAEYEFGRGSYSDDVIIPENVWNNGVSYNVTSVGDFAFSDCLNLMSVEIPNSVTSIGIHAFSECSSLMSVEIPNSVTSIGEWAYYGCENLTSIKIPTSVTDIGAGAFGGGKIKEILVAEENPMFRSYEGILYNKSLTELKLCPGGFTEVRIPNSVTSIGYGAFSNCDKLTSIEIPNSVTSFGERAFWSCSSLTLIEIPNSVTSIGNEAFSYCIRLASVKIPNSVTEIGNYAFRECNNLTEITSQNPIPPTAYSNSFYGLYNQSTLYVPKKAIEAYKSTSPWNSFRNIEAITVPAESIKLNPLTFYVGESVRMSADVLPEDATDVTVNWSSDAPEVAAVDADGKVWFNGAGEATVTAECQGYTAAMTFRVETVEAEALNVFPAEAVGPVGKSFYMLALHIPNNTTDKSVSWESSDPTVATVDEDGRIELLAEGQTTVTATSGAHTATATITVSGNTTDLIELSGNGVAIKVVDGGIDVVNAPEMARVIVSGVDGRVVTAMYAESAELHIPLASDIYLVKVGDTTTAKVLVK